MSLVNGWIWYGCILKCCLSIAYDKCHWNGLLGRWMENYKLVNIWNYKNSMCRHDKIMTLGHEATLCMVHWDNTKQYVKSRRGTLWHRDVNLNFCQHYNLVLIWSCVSFRAFVSTYKTREWLYVVLYTYIDCIFMLININWV